MKNEPVFVIIPAYNAERTISSVILDLHKCNFKTQIVVINDGSTDDTINKVTGLKIEILEHPENLGKGAALRTGFQWAQRRNANLILTLDADGQHNPFEAVKLMNKMSDQDADIVIGSRMSNLQKMPLHRILSNVITSKLITWRIKQNIEDSQSGFRLIRADVVNNIELTTNKFDLESEVIIKAGLSNYKIVSVPITTIYEKNSRSSVNFMDVLRFIVLLLRSFSWRRKKVYV